MLLEVGREPVTLMTDRKMVVRAGTSRVTLDAVLETFQAGATAEQIAQQYPSLALDDVYAVVTYCLRHRQLVDRYLHARLGEAGHVRRENETSHDPDGVRDRLLARRPFGLLSSCWPGLRTRGSTKGQVRCLPLR